LSFRRGPARRNGTAGPPYWVFPRTYNCRVSAVPQPALVEFYSGWDGYQRLLVEAIAGLEARQLDLQAAPHLWSIRMLANHIAATRVWWFHAWMKEGGAEYDEFMDWDEGEASSRRAAPDIVRGLNDTWSLVETRLRRWSPADLDAQFERPEPNAAGERPRRSRRWIIYHVLEHDVHHGGEISFSLGMNGLPGIGL
jgi:uncharacterized damage-inducible protein DinB